MFVKGHIDIADGEITDVKNFKSEIPVVVTYLGTYRYKNSITTKAKFVPASDTDSKPKFKVSLSPLTDTHIVTFEFDEITEERMSGKYHISNPTDMGTFSLFKNGPKLEELSDTGVCTIS